MAIASPQPCTFRFDPERVAYIETETWRSYYARNWRRMLGLMLELCRVQFHMNRRASILGAFYTVKASADWKASQKPLEHVEKTIGRFYRLARAFSGLQFDVERVSRLELRYWVEHARLKGQADKTPFVETMTELHSALFDISADAAARSAELRVQANTAVDGITMGTAQDPAENWREIERCLRECYRSIDEEMHR